MTKAAVPPRSVSYIGTSLYGFFCSGSSLGALLHPGMCHCLFLCPSPSGPSHLPLGWCSRLIILEKYFHCKFLSMGDDSLRWEMLGFGLVVFFLRVFSIAHSLCEQNGEGGEDSCAPSLVLRDGVALRDGVGAEGWDWR